ncbi:DnaJ domain-containing protein [Naematelia encephala]|uniref:DnaJ domain-containing protein n=1 Tax=Naematelia encephala TaxID=71784 RepID=A0A1Y2BCK7_9TREE|nr:DnaJ domain-containing protein [Naematelia encephala]
MSALLTPVLWCFLPSQITHFILPHLSSNFPAIFPPAPRNSPSYARNYRLAFTGVVVLWLSWTFMREGSSRGEQVLVEDWYALLGVARDVDDDGLKRAFRTLSRLYHPDRAGPGQEDTFILIRHAYETLLDPVKRYAYDRFGPDILTSPKTVSLREYMLAGLMRSSGFYIASMGFMLLLAVSGRARQGAYVMA